MASKGKTDVAMPPCSVCGGELNDAWECTICGTRHDPKGRAQSVKELSLEEALQRFTKIPGVGESKARALYENGFTSLESIRSSSLDDLARVPGIGERLARTIHEEIPRALEAPAEEDGPPGKAPAGGDGGTPQAGADALQKWLSGSSDQGLNGWLGGGAATGTGSTEALKRWLTGEEDALGQWLGEGRAPTGAPAGVSDAQVRERERLLEEREREIRAKEAEIEGLHAELDAIKRTMAQELREFKQGTFDPMKYVEETARLNRELQAEITHRKELEQEIEKIKRGSIAIIKYVKAQQMKAASKASPEVTKRLAEEVGAKRKAEAELKKTEAVLSGLRQQVEAGLAGMKPDERALKQRELALVEQEATLQSKEEELKGLEEAARRGEVDLGAGVSEELRSRLQEELREKEQEFYHREEDLKKRIILLEEEVNRFRIEEKLRAEAEALSGKPKGEVEGVLAKKERDLLTKEKSILLREQEIGRLQEELTFTKEEFEKLKQQVAYKDDELIRREEDLLYREKLMTAERRKIEEAKASGVSTEEKGLKERLEQLKAEINQKEEEVRAKEKYLKAKMEELRLREQGLIEEEIEAREEERMLEVKQEKVKTGTPRLDDLLLGGIPFGSNVSVYGPAYVGKEVIVNAFMAEGLKKGVACLFVITDKTPKDIREEMTFVLPGFEEYERLGLVKYVDAYSRSMGSEEQDPYTAYIDDPTDHETILKAVEELAKDFRKKHEYYRVCFRSISTLIAYLDPTTTFRFLQPFAGRRKRDKAVCMYLLEKGMHGEQEIQMLGSVMDGSIEIKVEQLKSFLAVKGICDVQSRAWIRYTYSKGGVNIGSFSLDHIR